MAEEKPWDVAIAERLASKLGPDARLSDGPAGHAHYLAACIEEINERKPAWYTQRLDKAGIPGISGDWSLEQLVGAHQGEMRNVLVGIISAIARTRDYYGIKGTLALPSTLLI